jgi:two-component system, sensor histidine kinase PdtaS
LRRGLQWGRRNGNTRRTARFLVALALFTDEVLTNIFKHAFPDGRQGVIRVSMETLPDGKLKLAIADNGPGITIDETRKSVGSRLIKTFGLQLGGVTSVPS